MTAGVVPHWAVCMRSWGGREEVRVEFASKADAIKFREQKLYAGLMARIMPVLKPVGTEKRDGNS